MSRSDRDPGEGRITTDRETIRGWVGENDAIPVRYSGVEGESGTLRIVPEAEAGEADERLEWNEFHDELEREDGAVHYRGSDHPEPFEVIDRDRAVGLAAVEEEAVEDALAEGETVRSEVRETTVVERTVVEEATVESEVTDREVLTEAVVDAELLTRDVVECELVDGHLAEGDWREERTFEIGGDSADVEGLGVEVLVDESWAVTKEVTERMTVESRVVEADSTEIDELEADTVEQSVDVEGVQRSVIESDLVDADAQEVRAIEFEPVESEFAEGDVVRTRLAERKTVEEEVSLRRRYTGDLTGAETTMADTASREVIDSEVVVDDEASGEAAPGAAPGPGGTSTTAEPSGTDEATVMDDDRPMPSPDDEGKPVVDARGDEVGMVADVAGETLYVDPHPSLADRIRTALGWGETDEDDTPIGIDRIERITDDRVELSSIEDDAPDRTDDAGREGR